MAGRPPKPTALKVLSGNPGKRPLPAEREVQHGPASKPAWLAKNESASLVWDDLAPERIALGLLTSVTSLEFAILCVYVAAFIENEIGMGDSARKDLRAHLSNFGYNPSALAKLGVATPRPAQPAKNVFANLLSSKRNA